MKSRIQQHTEGPREEVKDISAPPEQPSSSPELRSPEPSITTSSKTQHDTLHKKLEFYRDKLLQIERRSRSIMLRRIYHKWSFDLSELTTRGTSIADKAAENAILKKNVICLIPDSDRSDVGEKNKIKLRSLYRNITQLELETGLQETYLGFPFLVGHIVENFYIRGPAVLFPISIEHRKDGKPPGWYLSFSKEKPPIANRAMFAALKKKGNIAMPDSFYDEFEDLFEKVEVGSGKANSSLFRNQSSKVGQFNIEAQFVRELTNLLLKNDFPLGPSDNEENKVRVLEPLTVEQVKTMEKENLHFVSYKIIGNFPQGDTAIYVDYEELMKRAESGETNQGIIDNLLEIPSPEDVWNEGNEGGELADDLELDEIPTRKLNLAIESDASQDAVIVAAQSSECTVVRGPPGTGKSQVIVNLIANALANQKKVLLVCQKRAALDVVYQRLNKVGLSKYVALLHDPVNDRQELYRQMSRLLNFGSRTINTSMPSFDPLAWQFVESKMRELSQSIDNIISTQNAIVSGLRKQHFGGITAHQLYTLSIHGYTPKLDLSSTASRIQYHELVQLCDAIKNLESACRTFDAPSYPLLHRKSFASLGLNDNARLLQVMDELDRKAVGVKSITVLEDQSQQRLLIESLRYLATERGMFRKLKSKWGEASTTVKRLLSDQNFPADDVNHVNAALADAERRLNAALADAERNRDFLNTLAELSGFLDDTGFTELKSEIVPEFKRGPFLQRLATMKQALVNFDLIQEYDIKKAALNPLQKELLEICKSRLVDKTGWDEILRQEIYIHWIDLIERENPVLRNQPFETYLKNRMRLSEALKEHRNLVISQIAYRVEQRIVKPGTTARGKRSYKPEVSMWSKLADDLDKKRRVLPVRKLIEKYDSIIFNVAPCWLASPEAVASIFPLNKNLFDFIIFDEASQSAVERSLTSLYRGSHIIIMGDEKQLRPFDLFQTRDDEEDEEEHEFVDDTMLSESLLVLSKRIYGYRYLAWHYRSKSQELIDFSNHAFYDGHLQVAPNVLRSPNLTPITWIRCENGLWENRQNIPEAVFVVKEIKKILLKNQSEETFRSIGLITFNDSQRLAILDEIDRRRQEDLEFDKLFTAAENPESNRLDDKPFVKNIENVQGDERDIIIFSVGYAKDSEGHLRMRFGTLNQEGGENRLNVAITRARQEISIICSIDPDELRTDNAKNNGPKRLKEYLQYAKFISERRREDAENILLTLNDRFIPSQGTNNRGGVDITASTFFLESPFEEIVYERLRSLGYSVDKKVGYSGYKIDLAVVHPDDPSRYILAIECDSAAFYSAKSTRERDVMRQEFLESRGWVVERMWSRSWWKNPDRELDRIKQKIEELRKMA